MFHAGIIVRHFRTHRTCVFCVSVWFCLTKCETYHHSVPYQHNKHIIADILSKSEQHWHGITMWLFALWRKSIHPLRCFSYSIFMSGRWWLTRETGSEKERESETGSLLLCSWCLKGCGTPLHADTRPTNTWSGHSFNIYFNHFDWAA